MMIVCALLRWSVLAALAVSLSAQTPTGTILGSVQDSTAAMIPGAKILVREVSTNVERRSVSNELGYYEIPLLPPGNYQVEAEQPGFKRYVQPAVKLDTNQKMEIRILMTPGEVRETVE